LHVDLSNETAIGTRTPTRFSLGIQRRPFELLGGNRHRSVKLGGARPLLDAPLLTRDTPPSR
jgi:hypothetical protein